jgi:DNA-binding NtrC family response regulator
MPLVGPAQPFIGIDFVRNALTVASDDREFPLRTFGEEAMESRIWAVAIPPVQRAELADLLALARRVGVDIHPVDDPAHGELAAAGAVTVLRMENGLWLFWIDGDAALPAGESDAPATSSFALQCSAILAWPRDEALVQELLLCKANGQGRPCDPSTRGELEESFRKIGLIGRSPRFREALCLIVRLARYDVPVLLEGETGTGKELFARALHYLGPRRAKPFVPLNCGALPDSLLESQLFGHLRGVFTDARAELRGLVAQAEGGTLFFDEVHCLSAKGQVTLLRFLQDQLYRPLGAEQLRRADVRIVAATNCCLAREVAEGRFREDLFYRLKVAGLRLPPLRDRREDIPLLIESAVARLCVRFETGPRHFDAASLAWLATREWRGNVRELENFVCREFLLSDDSVIHVDPRIAGLFDDAILVAEPPLSYKTARQQVLSDFEARYLRTMLAATHGNVTQAACQAGKERRVFGRMMRKHGIDRREFAGNL